MLAPPISDETNDGRASLDASVRALCAIAAFHQIAADPETLAHAQGMAPTSRVAPDELVLAARHLA